MRSAGPRKYLLALGLGLLVFSLYWPSLAYPFQFDDQLFLREGNSRAHLGLAESYSGIGQEAMALQAAREAIRSATDSSACARALGVLEILESLTKT